MSLTNPEKQWRLKKTRNNQEGQNISRSEKETIDWRFASWKTVENFWRMYMTPREQRKVWPKKEQRRKGIRKEENKIKSLTPPWLQYWRFTKRKLLYNKKELSSYCKVPSWQYKAAKEEMYGFNVKNVKANENKK